MFLFYFFVTGFEQVILEYHDLLPNLLSEKYQIYYGTVVSSLWRLQFFKSHLKIGARVKYGRSE